MNRRWFLNSLGAAIVGTAIALKLPETIAPLNNWISKPRITYKALSEAYNSCCKGAIEPSWIIVSNDTADDIRSLVGFWTDDGHVKFRNAKIVKNGWFKNMPDDEIQIITNGTTYGDIGGRFYFT